MGVVNKSRFIPVSSPRESTKNLPFDSGREARWECRRCETLLGVRDGAELVIKFKGCEFTVRGHLARTCPRCSTRNEITTTGGD